MSPVLPRAGGVADPKRVVGRPQAEVVDRVEEFVLGALAQCLTDDVVGQLFVGAMLVEHLEERARVERRRLEIDAGDEVEVAAEPPIRDLAEVHLLPFVEEDDVGAALLERVDVDGTLQARNRPVDPFVAVLGRLAMSIPGRRNQVAQHLVDLIALTKALGDDGEQARLLFDLVDFTSAGFLVGHEE
jgi:hypothetical protein